MTQQKYWCSSSNNFQSYWARIAHVCKDKIVADVGCGNAELWCGHSEVDTIKALFCLDLVEYPEWLVLPFSKKVNFIRGSPSSLPHYQEELNIQPEVVLLNNVLPWLAYSEIKQLLLSIPDSVNTLVITTPLNLNEAPVVSLPPRRFFFEASPLNFSLGAASNLWVAKEDNGMYGMSTIITHRLAKWKQQRFSNYRIFEPCSNCGNPNDPQVLEVGNRVELLCSNCLFETSFVPISSDLSPTQEAVVFWNAITLRMYQTQTQ